MKPKTDMTHDTHNPSPMDRTPTAQRHLAAKSGLDL